MRDYLVSAIVLLVLLAACEGCSRQKPRFDASGFRELPMHYAAPDNPLRTDPALADQYRREGTVREPGVGLP